MNLEDRVRAVIQELQGLQHAFDLPGYEARLPESLLHEFKAAVDRLRLALWAYMETHADPARNDRETRIQEFRVERATEMLVALRTQMNKAGLGDEAHARNLLAEVHSLAELTPDYRRKRGV